MGSSASLVWFTGRHTWPIVNSSTISLTLSGVPGHQPPRAGTAEATRPIEDEGGGNILPCRYALKVGAIPHCQQVALSPGRKGKGAQDTPQTWQDACGVDLQARGPLLNTLSIGAPPNPLHLTWAKDLLRSPSTPAPCPQSPRILYGANESWEGEPGLLILCFF